MISAPELGVATFDQVLNAPIKLTDYYLVLAKVLQRESGRTAQVVLLERLASLSLPALNLTLGKLIDISSATASAMNANLNLLDLVSAAAFVANGTNVISIPDLSVNLGGVTTLHASITVGKKPQFVCGTKGTLTAHSDQVDIHLWGNATNLNLGLLSLETPIDLNVRLAPVDVLVTDVTCSTPTKRVNMDVSSGLFTLSIGLEAKIKLLLGLIKVAEGPITATTSKTSAASSGYLDILNDDYKTPVLSTGQSSLGVPALNVDTSKLTILYLPLGKGLDFIVSPLLSVVLNPLVAALDSLVLSPLLDSLGLQVAGGDVKVTAAACGVPRLVG